MNVRTMLALLLGAVLLCPGVVLAHDTDGPNDCQRLPVDFGDAPEGIDAYPGVTGHFPTCITPTPAGTQTLAGCSAVSLPPALTGYVRHVAVTAIPNFWLGCTSPFAAPLGIDSDLDGKVSAAGGPQSACSAGQPIDCVELAPWGASYGQDECTGDDDAGVAGAISLLTCAQNTLRFKVANCGQTREVYLNILVDWNHDGDWNDLVRCTPTGPCVPEWAVKNVLVGIPSGCTEIVSPPFAGGDTAGPAWLRLSVSAQPMPDDFPWNGTAGLPNASIVGGETEDYPVSIGDTPPPCPNSYKDYGDAPENIPAYASGILGAFPTCTLPGPVGTVDVDPNCPAISSQPGPAGFVRHNAAASDPVKFGLGCGNPLATSLAVDGEEDGKVSHSPPPGAPSACNSTVLTDCVELTPWGVNYGQDECYGDLDAGVAGAVTFDPCTQSSVRFNAYNCATGQLTVYLNVLVDWNEDGDWNDAFRCGAACAYEWAVKNVVIILPNGCSPQVSPLFLTGPRGGSGWMRITLTSVPVGDDFPWNGSAGLPTQEYTSGETEDYPVKINTPPNCPTSYIDFGDAPEGFSPYPNLAAGHFPTCLQPTPPGTIDVPCGTPAGSFPGLTGYVEHVATTNDPAHFWLGCGAPPNPPFGGIDGEPDGKTSPGGAVSFCGDNPVDCIEPSPWGQPFGQDECTGDFDAGIASAIEFPACSTSTVPFRAVLCEDTPVTVFLNILADWNQDGDWNDMVQLCNAVNTCTSEWVVKNVQIVLTPGCQNYVSPTFLAGRRLGPTWMRISLSAEPVNLDFPWAGSATMPGGFLHGGESEDYPVTVKPSLIGVEDGDVPLELALGAPRPNPSTGAISMRWSLPKKGSVRIGVYDVAGRLVRTLFDGEHAAGVQTIVWDGRTVRGAEAARGVYLIRFEAAGRVLTQRATRLR